MRASGGLILFLAACLLAAGCAGNRRLAGTGDVAFRLLWEGTSDIDLYVKDPSGACVFFARRQSPSGGILDIDCNGTMDSTCSKPVENVYWPAATAEAGDYLFWVHVHTVFPPGKPLPFELQLLRGDEVFWAHHGEARAAEEIHGPFTFRFPSSTAPSASAEDEHETSACSY